MIQKEFFPNKTALVTLIAACLVVIISLGIRQTFGLFFFDFEIDLGCTQTEFGFAMGIQLFFWGLFGPIFGIITDKFSGRVAVFIGFLFYLAGDVVDRSLQVVETALQRQAVAAGPLQEDGRQRPWGTPKSRIPYGQSAQQQGVPSETKSRRGYFGGRFHPLGSRRLPKGCSALDRWCSNCAALGVTSSD